MIIKKLSIYLLRIIVGSLLFTWPGMVYSSDKNDSDYLLSLSLAELLNVDVISASKKEESIATAPAIISVFTRQEIIDTGSKNIIEALSIMTGIFTYDTYFSEYNLVSIRNNFGGEHYLSKILFLINGHPTFSPVNGSVKLTALSINAVERIEVVRGPVAVLYGTNALTGVINVITRKGSASEKSEVSIGFGSDNKRKLDFSISDAKGDLNYFISGSYQKEDGYGVSLLPEQDEAGVGRPATDFGENILSLFSNISYQGFDLDFFYSDVAKDHKIGIIPNTFFSGVDTFDDKQLYLDFRYQQMMNDDISLNYKVRYDKLEVDYKVDGIYLLESAVFDLDSPPHITEVVTDATKMGAEFYANINFSDEWDLNTGLAYDKYKASPYLFAIDSSVVATGNSPLSPFVDSKSDHDAAFYANTNYLFSEKSSLTAGIRHTENNTSGGQTDYRVGLISEINDEFIFKGLFATSFRSANFFERYATSAPILQGDVDLKNETLKGLDLGLYYTNTQTKIALIYYQNETEDFIKRRLVNGVVTYVNLPQGEKISGIELELKHFFSPQLSLFLNASHALTTEDGATGDELEFTLDNLYNFGITYKPTEKITLNTYNSYRSDWDQSDSYMLSNLYMTYKTESYNKQLSFFLSINNIFDEQYTYAEFSRGNIATIPGGASRTYFGGVTMSF